MAGAGTDLHERPGVLSDSVIDLHRALVSLRQELEAIDCVPRTFTRSRRGSRVTDVNHRGTHGP
jgi:hypothetical protein